MPLAASHVSLATNVQVKGVGTGVGAESEGAALTKR